MDMNIMSYAKTIEMVLKLKSCPKDKNSLINK
jgi:hypothetical protein